MLWELIKLANSCLVLFMFLQHVRSSLVVLSWLFLFLFLGSSGDDGGDGSNDTMTSESQAVTGVTQTKTGVTQTVSGKAVVGSDNTVGSNNTVGTDDTMGSDDRGVVDDVVGGVGGGLGVHSNLGHVMNLMVDLVSDQTSLGNQVGPH